MDIKTIAEAIKAETDPEKLGKLYEDYQKQIDELNEKAGKFKEIEQKGIFKELEETRKKLKDIEDAKRKADEDEAIKKGELQKLLDIRAEELKAKEKELESLKGEVDPLKKFKEERIAQDEKRKEELIAKLPDNLKDIAKDLSGINLEKFIDLHKTPNAAKPDGGDGITGQQPLTLTDAQKKDAAEKFPSITDEKEREELYKTYLDTKPKKKE